MKKIRARVWSVLLVCAMLLALFPVSTFAEPGDGTTPNGQEIYVAATGSDETGDGTQENPYATLATAVEKAAGGSVIKVTTDLMIPNTIRIEKNLTIQGQGTVTISAENAYMNLFDLSSDVSVSFKDLQFSGSNFDNSTPQSDEIYGSVIGADSDSAVAFLQNISIAVENCKFSDFEAYIGGVIGLRYTENVTLDVRNSEFSNNKANVSGGAIGLVNCKSVVATIEACVFEQNVAGARGGAFASEDSYDGIETISFSGCQFKNNEINRENSPKVFGGGAIGISDDSGTNRVVGLTNCVFENNTSDDLGGAVFVNATNKLDVTGCDFTGNSATLHGGAMNIACGNENTQIEFSGNTFDGNISGGQGGAINFWSGGLNANIDSALFESNTTDLPAGNAIAFFGSSTAATQSAVYSTNGAAFLNNGSADDGIDRDTLYIEESKSKDDVVKITDYMLDGTRLNWKKLVKNEQDEDVLVSAARDEYGEISGDKWDNAVELYLDADTAAPTLAREQYSNVFVNNHASYGGAICNYGSLTIGQPGRDITVTKTWQDAAGNLLSEGDYPKTITVNLLRQADQSLVEKSSVTADNGWTKKFYDFPQNVACSVTEDQILGYQGTVTVSESNVSVLNSLLGNVEITPADITVYTGGDGYDGVVKEDGTIETDKKNGLPEAGFYIELPKDLDQQIKQQLGVSEDTTLNLSEYLHFESGDKTWSLELYDGEQTSIVDGKYIYRLVAPENQAPVRMQFISGGEEEGTEEKVEISDRFDLDNALYSKYTMGIYPGAVEAGTVRAVILVKEQETKYPVEAHTGTLTIRGVTKAGSTTEVVSGVTQPVSSVTAVLPKDAVYTVNDSDVKVVDGRPSLLVDEIVSTDNSASGSDYRGVLVDKAVKLVGEGFQNVATQAKYLDLVDAANGNTWIQTDSKVTIYWPYPQGTDANTKFRLVHFDGLDREMTADEVMDAINKNEPVVVKDLVTDQYGIRFETDSFSPFVLVWDNTQTTTVTEEDDHPDIAEAIANGTWGQPTPTPAPAVVPQTGDNMPVMLLVILAVVAAGAIIVLVVVHKRNRH